MKHVTASATLDHFIPTSLKKEGYSFGDVQRSTIEKAMMAFAKYHVTQALHAANAAVYVGSDFDMSFNAHDVYPLTKVK